MTTDTLLLILTGLCAFLAAAVVWLVLEMRLLKIQTSENLRRDEQDEMIEAILTGVRSERQEVQQAVLNVERGVSQTLAGLTGYLTEQQNTRADDLTDHTHHPDDRMDLLQISAGGSKLFPDVRNRIDPDDINAQICKIQEIIHHLIENHRIRII